MGKYASDPCASKDDEGQSALHHACLGGDLETVRYVTDNGAPGTCNERDKNDMTPFHLACEGGFLDVVVSVLRSRVTVLHSPSFLDALNNRALVVVIIIFFVF